MYPESLEKLIECFRTLPGVGQRTAERYALLIFEEDPEKVQTFADAMINVKQKVHKCRICGNLSETEECPICSNPDRNHKQIFVVQSARDVIAMEKTGEYKGVYHVLGGLISSTKGVMPEDLNIDTLIERAQDADEIILATSATMDGETTAMYLDKVLKNRYPDILITRIAHGIPAGGMLDYADEMTLSHALTDRRKMQ